MNDELAEPLPALTVRLARGVHVTIPWELVQTQVAMVLPVPGDKRSVFLFPTNLNPMDRSMLLTSAPPIPTIPERLMTRHAPQMTSIICFVQSMQQWSHQLPETM